MTLYEYRLAAVEFLKLEQEYQKSKRMKAIPVPEEVSTGTGKTMTRIGYACLLVGAILIGLVIKTDFGGLLAFLALLGCGGIGLLAVVLGKAQTSMENKAVMEREEALRKKKRAERQAKALEDNYFAQQEALRRAKAQFPELRGRTLFFDYDYKPSNHREFVSYEGSGASYVMADGEPAFLAEDYDSKPALTIHGFYAPKRCKVGEVMAILRAGNTYCLLEEDTEAIAVNMDSECQVFTMYDWFNHPAIPGRTALHMPVPPEKILQDLPKVYSSPMDRFLLSGLNGRPNLSVVPDHREATHSYVEHLHMPPYVRTGTYGGCAFDIIRLGYLVKLSATGKILCAAVPTSCSEYMGGSVNFFQTTTRNTVELWDLAGHVTNFGNTNENNKRLKGSPDPVRVTKYLLRPTQMEKLPPLDPLAPIPRHMPPAIWRYILLQYANAGRAIKK